MIDFVAALVREEMEDFVLTQSSCNFDHQNLCGACGIASWVLDRVLRRFGYQSKLVMGRFEKDALIRDGNSNHCWVEVDGHIVDVTATQFDIPFPVYYVVQDPRYFSHHHGRSAQARLAGWGGQSQMNYRVLLDDMVTRVVKVTKQYNKLKQIKAA